MATETRKTKRLKDRITKIQLLQVYQTVGPEGKVRNKKDRRVVKEGDTNCRNQIKQVFEEEEEEENYNNEDERSRMVRFSGSQDKGEEVQIFKEGKEEFFKEDEEEIKKDKVEIFKEGKVEIFKGDKMKLFKADGMKFLYQLRMQVLKTVMR